MRNKIRATDITICEAGFSAQHPELYHYTNRTGLEGIVRSNTIWATHYRSLNDSSEIVHLREPLIEAVSPKFDAIIQRQNLNDAMQRLYFESGGPQRLARDFVNSLYGATFEKQNGCGSVDAFISSFCTHAADRPYEQENGLLSQWRSYSGDDGYCIIFDSLAICRLLGDEWDRLYWLHLNISAVTYAVDGVAIESVFRRLVEASSETLEEFFRGVAEPELMTAADFLEGAARFKHQGFHEEREVRIVAMPGTATLAEYAKKEHREFEDKPLPDIQQRPPNGPLRIALFEGRDVKLPIKRVIVGPSRNQAEKAAAARKLMGESVAITCSHTPWLPSAGDTQRSCIGA
jgi:hypothetical protein